MKRAIRWATVLAVAAVGAYFLATGGGAGGPRAVSGSILSAIMPPGLSGKEVEALCGLVMEEESLADLLAELPERSRQAIPDVETIRRHLDLRSRKVNNYYVVDVHWAYEKPRQGRFAMPEEPLQLAIVEKLEKQVLGHRAPPRRR
ncbi:hypothetical protein ACFL2T_05430 [Elusimicrobiota bacterium]